MPMACAAQQEKQQEEPLQGEAYTRQQRVPPIPASRKEPAQSNKGPPRPKVNEQTKFGFQFTSSA